MKFKVFFTILFFLLIIISCKTDPLDIKPSDKNLGIAHINLDSIFVNTPENKLVSSISNLGLNKNEILDYQLSHCLGIGELNDSAAKRIKSFISDPYISRVETEIKTKFPNLSETQNKIATGFQYLATHFPKGKIPKKIIYMNSFFASNVFCTENEIGIGLERYLGADKQVIKELPSHEFYQWIKDGMKVEYLERDVLTAWIMTHYIPENKSNTAEAIVKWGKIIYLTEAAFPKEEKHIILRYSKKDFEWAEKNEMAFWKYLVDEKLLFSENERDQSNFLHDAPFTIGLPEKGPDRLGQFLGWKIVHSFMEKNPEMTLEKLITIPYNTILQAYEI
jgi:hypothetical protein